MTLMLFFRALHGESNRVIGGQCTLEPDDSEPNRVARCAADVRITSRQSSSRMDYQAGPMARRGHASCCHSRNPGRFTLTQHFRETSMGKECPAPMTVRQPA